MMIDDLSTAVLEFASDYVIKRSAGTGVLGSDGFYVANSDEDIDAKGVVWPATGRERQQLEQGERGLDSIGFAFTIPVRTVDAPAGRPADRIVHAGAEWVVKVAAQWGHLGNFSAGVAVRAGQ